MIGYTKAVQSAAAANGALSASLVGVTAAITNIIGLIVGIYAVVAAIIALTDTADEARKTFDELNDASKAETFELKRIKEVYAKGGMLKIVK